MPTRTKRLCIECGVWRIVNDACKDRPEFQPDVYVCKWCKNKDLDVGSRTWQRRIHLKNRYGITLEDYDAMLILQGGACGICKRLPNPKELYVDHDHVTGEIRGLLCNRCNVVLEWFLEYADPALLYMGNVVNIREVLRVDEYDISKP